MQTKIKIIFFKKQEKQKQNQNNKKTTSQPDLGTAEISHKRALDRNVSEGLKVDVEDHVLLQKNPGEKSSPSNVCFKCP